MLHLRDRVPHSIRNVVLDGAASTFLGCLTLAAVVLTSSQEL